MTEPQSNRNQWLIELTHEEKMVFFELPEWHMEAFINWPDPLCDIKDELFGENNLSKDDFFNSLIDFDEKKFELEEMAFNLYVIKSNIQLILNKDSDALKQWVLSRKVRSFFKINREMSIEDISNLIFPFSLYNFHKEEFKNSLIYGLGFKDGIIKISDLKKIIDSMVYLRDSGNIAFEVWNKYLEDKEEAIKNRVKQNQELNKAIKMEIFGDTLDSDKNKNSSKKDIKQQCEVASKKDTQEIYKYWNDEVEQLWKTGNFKTHKAVCEEIERQELGRDPDSKITTANITRRTREKFQQLKGKNGKK